MQRTFKTFSSTQTASSNKKFRQAFIKSRKKHPSEPLEALPDITVCYTPDAALAHLNIS